MAWQHGCLELETRTCAIQRIGSSRYRRQAESCYGFTVWTMSPFTAGDCSDWHRFCRGNTLRNFPPLESNLYVHVFVSAFVCFLYSFVGLVGVL